MLLWILLLVTLSLWWFYTKYQSGYWVRRGIPHDQPYPIVGSFWPVITLRKPPGLLLKELYNHPNARKSPLFGFHIFGKPAILLRGPELIKQILIKDFNYFSDRFSFIAPQHDFLAGRNLFFIKGKYWKAIRVTLTPTFTSKRMRDMFPLVNKCATDLIGCLKNEKAGTVTEFKELIARCTTDIISLCAFGINSGCLSNENSDFRKHGKTLFDNYGISRTLKTYSSFFAPHFITERVLKSDFFDIKTTNFLRSAFNEALESRKKHGNRRNDLIDVLSGLKEKGSISYSSVDKEDHSVLELNEKDLLAQAAVYFAGGFETSTTTISFALHELSRSLEIQQKLREEIEEKIKEFGSLSAESLAEMTYLDQVVNETLRKYPPLPFLDREVNRDYKIPDTNIVLEKGTPLYVSLEGLHYDPEYFPNPDVFDPERFSEKMKNSRPAFAYLPFGEGPRNCIGSRFGLMVTKCILANIVSSVELSPNPSKPLVPLERNKRTFMTHSKDGIDLKIRHLKTTLA
uniref:Cytochrome P450 6NQ1 n=1 Tax=Forficula auricularia TaxID=13068 RepID=A0A5P8N8F2_FORAU|nr:cytochrome P450 6NQ1 [Forficula auricularia]